MIKFLKRFLIFVLVFVFQIKLSAEINIKGEAELTASPLSILQEKDSILTSRYKSVKLLLNNREYSISLEQGLNLLDTLKKERNKELEYLCTFLIADAFSKLNSHDKSILYFKKSLSLINNEKLLTDFNINYYDNTFNLNSLRAKNFLRIGTQFARLNLIDSAKTYFNKVIEIKSLDEKLNSVKASAYTNLSGVFIRNSLYSQAKIYALKSVELRRSLNDKLNESAALGNLASIHVLEKDYLKAKQIYFKAIDLIDKNNSSTAVKYKEDLYYNLAWALYNLKDFKAYDYQEKSYLIKDSIRNIEFEHIVQQVYEKYQLEIAKKNASKAEAEAALEKAEERKTNWFLGALILLILIISGVILYNYKLRQKNLKLKLDQTQLAQKSKLEKLKSESQVRILNATLDGKETERKQIAETLHDSVSSLLSSANLHLQATKMQFNGDSPIEIDKTQKIIIEASQTIRDLSHTLVSSVLLKFGLKYAIKDMAEKYSNSQIQINTDLKNLRRYHQGFEIKVNNIIQEFVNNILKHSHASKAIVRVEDKNAKLIISIQDNGDGFDKETIPEKDGLGINQIDARIQMMKGDFYIDSCETTGTKIDIVLPILEKETPIRV